MIIWLIDLSQSNLSNMKSEENLLFKLASKGNIADLFDFINCSANPNILSIRDTKGRQLTHIAAKEKQAGCLYQLIKRGCKLDSKCDSGNTILHYACASSSLCCAVILLQMGCNLREQNLSGQTPIDLTFESNYGYFGELLRKAELEVSNRKVKFRHLTASVSKIQTIFQKDCNNPVVMIENEFPITSSCEVAKGPLARYCQGYFSSTHVFVKYVACNDSNKTNESEILLLKEAVLARHLRHPNVLLLMGICLNTTNCSLVFEFASLGFLHRVVFQSDINLNSIDVLNIGRDISNALQYIHSESYIHCSVTCFSVTLSRNMVAKLCNFEHSTLVRNASSISHLPSLYPYMAMEQLQGKCADQCNDVYGLGVIIFECMTRKKIQDINASQQRFSEKDLLAYRIKFIPDVFERSLKTLVSQCFSPASERPSSRQIYHWVDCLLDGRITSREPSALKNIEEEFHH